MVWLRLDDAMLDNPKIAHLTPLAFSQFVAALLWSSRNMRDGIVPWPVMGRLFDWTGVYYDKEAVPFEVSPSEGTYAYTGWTAVNTELVDRGLLHPDVLAKGCTSDICHLAPRPTAEEFLIHDFLFYNPSSDELLASRSEVHDARSRAGKIRAAQAHRVGGRFIAAPPGQDIASTASTPPAVPPARHQHATSPEPVPVKNNNTRRTLHASAEDLALLFVKLLEENGVKPQSTVRRYAEHADLLLRLGPPGPGDPRPVDPEQARAVLQWCQRDPFWKVNIQGMETFRKQYDKLRLRWQEERQPNDHRLDLPPMILEDE